MAHVLKGPAFPVALPECEHPARRAPDVCSALASDFSKEAQDFVTRVQHRIVLINGQRFVDLMLKHGVGVRVRATYTIQTVDEDCFSYPSRCGRLVTCSVPRNGKERAPGQPTSRDASRRVSVQKHSKATPDLR